MTGGTPEVSAPLLGQVVADRYFVEKHLGEGGMGTVYRARHITLEKKVALKVLHGEFSRKQDLVDRFLQEAKAASSIRNEHVIDITDFGVTGDGYVFFAMEYLQGQDLHSELRNVVNSGQLFPWARSQEVFLQVCEALAAAHAQGIIHRDLKPENIFLVEGTGRGDYIKLLDFGIAKVTSPTGEEGERKLTKTGVLFGTPEYMAPEQARGEKPDHRVDVYAMGCLLFQFLTGTVPFKAESFMAILTQHMVEPVPEISVDLLKRSGAPTGVLGIVEKALAKDREERFSTISELAEAVASVGEMGAPAVAAPPRGKRSARETALTNRRNRPSTHGNWTGSVRQISDIADEEEQVEAVAVAIVEDRSKSNGRLFAGLFAGAVLIGGGAAAATMMGGDADSSAPTESNGIPSVEGQAPIPSAAAATPDTAGARPALEAPDAGVTPNLIPDAPVKPVVGKGKGKKPAAGDTTATARDDAGKGSDIAKGGNAGKAEDDKPNGGDSKKPDTKASDTNTKTDPETTGTIGAPEIKDPFGGSDG